MTMDRNRERLEAFKHALKARGFKETAQRDDIARVFFARGGHVSIDELHAEVKKVNPRVGYATVHRTVRLLRDLGFATERHFDDAPARYERADDEDHHDHLICERCGRIVEFQSEEIEALQESVARALDFVVSHHRMELYGICRECREGRQRRTRRGGNGKHIIHRL
jgi:Fur family ferric uptake transcriptional regulator